MLQQQVIAKLGPFGDWAEGGGQTVWTLNADHDIGSGQRTRYRLKLTGTAKDVTCRIGWDEVTVYPDGRSQATHQEEHITGTVFLTLNRGMGARF